MMQIDDALFQRLRDTPIFKSWPEAALLHLQSHCRAVPLRGASILFSAGSQASAFYFVLSGRMLLSSSSAAGHEKIVEIIQPGQLFALAVGFLGRRYPVTATSEGRAELIEIPFAPFLGIIKEQPELTWQMLADLSIRLNFLINEVRRMGVESADTRVGQYLLDLCPQHAGPARVELPCTKAALAARLGIKPETLSRVFARMQQAGAAVVGRRHVDIPCPEALQQWTNRQSEPDNRRRIKQPAGCPRS